MINPFTTTEEDKFATGDLMANRRPLNTFPTEEENTKPTQPENQPTIKLPDDRTMEIESTKKPERLMSDIDKLSQAYKEFVGEEYQPFTAEQELEMKNYQEQEFAKARQQRAAEINSEEKTALADYQQRVASGIEPVKQTIDYASRAEKAFNNQIGKLNNIKIQILSDDRLSGTKAGARALKTIDQQMLSLEGVHKLNLETLGGKAYIEAPMEVKEVYNNNFMAAVRNGALSPSDAIRYSSEDVSIKSKVQPMIDELISQGKNQEAQELSNRIFGRERLDALGRPLPGREGGLVKQTNFGTYQYNTDSKIFDQNLNNTLVNLGVKKPEKPQDLFKPEEDILKGRIGAAQNEVTRLSAKDEVTPEEQKTIEQLNKSIESDNKMLLGISESRAKSIGLPAAEEAVRTPENFTKDYNELINLESYIPKGESGLKKGEGRAKYEEKANSIIQNYGLTLKKFNSEEEKGKFEASAPAGQLYAYQIGTELPRIAKIKPPEVVEAEKKESLAKFIISEGLGERTKGGFLLPKGKVSKDIKKQIEDYNDAIRRIQFGNV